MIATTGIAGSKETGVSWKNQQGRRPACDDQGRREKFPTEKSILGSGQTEKGRKSSQDRWGTNDELNRIPEGPRKVGGGKTYHNNLVRQLHPRWKGGKFSATGKRCMEIGGVGRHSRQE